MAKTTQSKQQQGRAKQTIKLADLKLNKKNPRKISRAELDDLKRKLEKFPEMMEERGIVVDENNVIKGGNQRYKALLELGYTEVPATWVSKRSDWTDEQFKDFVIYDNKSAGRWDEDILIEEYEIEYLQQENLPVKQVEEEKAPEVEFSEELMLEHNYVVLYFDNPMDWQVAIDKLGLKEVKSAIKTVKSQKVGIGRVIKGAPIINRL